MTFKEIAKDCPWQQHYPPGDGKNDRIALKEEWICNANDKDCTEENCGIYHWKERLLLEKIK